MTGIRIDSTTVRIDSTEVRIDSTDEPSIQQPRSTRRRLVVGRRNELKTIWKGSR